MQQQSFSVRRMTAMVALSLLIVMAAQQACAAPVQSLDAAQSSSQQAAGPVAERSLHTPRRVARMTALWRIMTKPVGAYCKENMECSTGLCRNGFCRSALEPAKS